MRRESFNSGQPALDKFLKQYARQNQKKGLSRTYIASPEEDTTVIAGFYSISMAQIEYESLPEPSRKGMPRYPVPAFRIGQLAVDQDYQGQGLGAELLIQALLKATHLSREIGIYAVVVDALNENAKSFYLKYNFISYLDKPNALFLPIMTIKKMFN